MTNIPLLAEEGLCTKNTSWALIERPYSCAPQAVGAVYDRPGFFVQSREEGNICHLEVQGVGFQPEASACFLKGVLSKRGWFR